MIVLSERLDKIASFVRYGDRVADIGTDHGYIPIYLKQRGISRFIVAGDINEGPLEKLEENLEKYLGGDREGIVARLGSGLEVIQPREVNTVVIAGMGGLLMQDILSADWKRTKSVERFILQPRNAQDKLRKWLLENGFRITGEVLARENRFIWEIMCAEPANFDDEKEATGLELEKKLKSEYFGGKREQYEVGQLIIKNRDPLIQEFIANKLSIERRISENAGKSDSAKAALHKKQVDEKIEMLEEILENVGR